MAFVLDEEMQNVTNIKVIGVGGGGGNAVNRMVESGLSGVEFVAMNTDQQALLNSKATQKVQLGAKLTKGRGAGADPEIGQRAAEESKDEISNALKGAQMVFITAGMGGGTGTGAAPVVAETAHDLGILTVGIVTKPFAFEGKRKMSLAEQGIASLMMHVDSLIVIPNERLKLISQERITLMNAFEAADNVLRQGVESISSLINIPAFINLDFADVRSIMKDAGFAHMGVGVAKGAGKAENAAKAAISSPLLETSIAGARGVIQPGHRPGGCRDRCLHDHPVRTSRCQHHLGYCVRRAPERRDEHHRRCHRLREHPRGRRAHPGPCRCQARCRPCPRRPAC